MREGRASTPNKSGCAKSGAHRSSIWPNRSEWKEAFADVFGKLASGAAPKESWAKDASSDSMERC